MISKYGCLDLEPDQVRAIFVDTDQWPRWMPGVNTVRTLRPGEHRRLLDLHQRLRGHAFDMELDCSFAGDRLRFVQTRGSMRRWECTWHLDPAPDGRGTTVRLDIDMELGGLWGLLVSDRFMDGFLDELFNETLQRLNARAQELETRPGAQPPPPGQDVLLRLYQTEQGMELWYGGRSFPLTPGE